MFGFRRHRSTQDAIIRVTDHIKYLKSQGLKVAAVAIDATAAFDTVGHQLILSTLEAVGVGPKMTAWIRSFTDDCHQHVDINGTLSKSWSSDVGLGQGRKLSPDLYNIASLSAAFWSRLSEAFLFADDGLNVVSAPTTFECNDKILSVTHEIVDWFDMAGLTLNIKKSEIIGFGFTPNPVTINGQVITPTSEIKFLGTWIQSDLKYTRQVDELCKKIRSSAARIRSEGKHFSYEDRRLLYFGWTQGILSANGLAILPCLPANELTNLQTSCNAAIRAIMGLPRFDKTSISKIRHNLKIPSVTNIRDRCLAEAAWKKHAGSFTPRLHGPSTRSQTNMLLLHPNQKGLLGKSISSKTDIAWNKLPLEIKKESSVRIAANQIKKHIYNF